MYLICYLRQGNWVSNIVVPLWLLMYNLLRKKEFLKGLERYRRLVEKLNYFIVTHPDIAYSVSVLS